MNGATSTPLGMRPRTRGTPGGTPDCTPIAPKGSKRKSAPSTPATVKRAKTSEASRSSLAKRKLYSATCEFSDANAADVSVAAPSVVNVYDKPTKKASLRPEDSSRYSLRKKAHANSTNATNVNEEARKYAEEILKKKPDAPEEADSDRVDLDESEPLFDLPKSSRAALKLPRAKLGAAKKETKPQTSKRAYTKKKTSAPAKSAKKIDQSTRTPKSTKKIDQSSRSVKSGKKADTSKKKAAESSSAAKPKKKANTSKKKIDESVKPRMKANTSKKKTDESTQSIKTKNKSNTSKAKEKLTKSRSKTPASQRKKKSTEEPQDDEDVSPRDRHYRHPSEYPPGPGYRPYWPYPYYPHPYERPPPDYRSRNAPTKRAFDDYPRYDYFNPEPNYAHPMYHPRYPPYYPEYHSHPRYSPPPFSHQRPRPDDSLVPYPEQSRVDRSGSVSRNGPTDRSIVSIRNVDRSFKLGDTTRPNYSECVSINNSLLDRKPRRMIEYRPAERRALGGVDNFKKPTILPKRQIRNVEYAMNRENEMSSVSKTVEIRQIRMRPANRTEDRQNDTYIDSDTEYIRGIRTHTSNRQNDQSNMMNKKEIRNLPMNRQNDNYSNMVKFKEIRNMNGINRYNDVSCHSKAMNMREIRSQPINRQNDHSNAVNLKEIRNTNGISRHNDISSHSTMMNGINRHNDVSSVSSTINMKEIRPIRETKNRWDELSMVSDVENYRDLGVEPINKVNSVQLDESLHEVEESSSPILGRSRRLTAVDTRNLTAKNVPKQPEVPCVNSRPKFVDTSILDDYASDDSWIAVKRTPLNSSPWRL